MELYRGHFSWTMRGNPSWTLATVLANPVVVFAPSGMTFKTLSDQSVLAGGVVPGQGIYVVSDVTNLSGITGIRLEVLEDPSLPGDGPGFFSNGNFVLTELHLDTTAPVPEPATYSLMLVGLGFISFALRRHLH